MMRRKSKPERASPRLRAAFLQIVQNQLDANDPPETRETVERLMAQGISAQDSKRYIAQAVAAEVWYILHENETFDLDRYVKNLERLPAPPWEEGEEEGSIAPE